MLEVGPDPWLILSSKEVEQGDNMGEVRDKFAIKVRKSKKRANTFDRGGGFPFLNGREFDIIHFNLSLADDHAKEFDVWNIKGTFGEFERQSVFLEMK